VLSGETVPMLALCGACRYTFQALRDVGISALVNRRDQMQDTYVVVDGYGGASTSFLAVYDGHGGT
jgi:serine/threonine protein phosphatase PrpC